MRTLHLDLKTVKDNYVELQYFFDNPNNYKSRSLPLSEIADLLQLAEQDYYVYLAVDYAVTGRKLYNWLDGSDRLLQQLLNQHQGEGIVLAIATAEKLAHLPWEVLHDGNSFLVERVPGVIPVRWVSSDAVKQLSIEAEPENRALQVLFMATSPLGVEPVLDFEAEEGRILEATARQPLALTVEESGCLSELGYLVDDYRQGYFDVFHLTGHATFTDGEPRFITETETGDANYASATDIAKELQFRLPKLIFLSGCRTGQGGKSGAVPSMAEELLAKGAKAVLGWGQSVLESEATVAASTLYQALSTGKAVTEAVACTYQKLIENKARDWHLLRLYAAGTLPGNLVTPLRTRGRKPAPKPSVAEQFLDPAGKVKVPTRENFIGRRRQLQNCLRALKPPSQDVGVLIHGMGGLGKSSLAARLCDRLPEFERLVWVGRVDEPSLVNKLAAALDSRELREALQDDKEELKFRLRRVFRQLKDEAAKPLLLVLDDFEANLEPRDDGYVLQPEAVIVLEALVCAIKNTYAPHRLILTCRYDFESNLLQDFYKQPLEGLRGADLRKKCSRLCAFDAKSQVDEALQSQARRLADGNPRLLEWLNKVLLDSTVDREAIFQRLEADPVELREQVLAAELLQQMDSPIREMLSRGLVFELPVPREALAVICESIPNLEQHIDRAVALGLLEVSPDKSLRVPRILPLRLGEDENLTEGFDVTSLYQQAAEVLYCLWWEGGKLAEDEQKTLEIHRLALRGKVEKIAVEIAFHLANYWTNRSRFREAVQLCQSTLEISKDYRIWHELGRSEESLGGVANAKQDYQKALDICPSDDEKEKAAILHNLASLQAKQGQIEEAITLYEQSLAIEEAIGNILGKAVTLHELGSLKAKQGQIEEAITLFQQSLVINKTIDNVQVKAATLNQLGSLKFNQGQIEEAITLLKQSLAIEETIGNVRGKAATLRLLGWIYSHQGKVNEAFALFQQSLEIEESIENAEGKAEALYAIAEIYTQQGQIEEAIPRFEQSLAINETIGNAQGTAATLLWLGVLVANVQGDFDTALEYLQQSLKILELIQSPDAEVVRQLIDRVQQMAQN